MSYVQLRTLAMVLTIVVAGIGLIQSVGPASLGLPPIAANWLGVLGGAIGVALGFLPRVQTNRTDPIPLYPDPPAA